MRGSFHDLLLRLSGAHQSPISKSVFLINNYDVILQVIRGALGTSERHSSTSQDSDGGMDGSSVEFFEQQVSFLARTHIPVYELKLRRRFEKSKGIFFFLPPPSSFLCVYVFSVLH